MICFLYVFFAAFATGVNVINYYVYSGIDVAVFSSNLSGCRGVAFPAAFDDDINQNEVSGWAMFANTLIWRLCKLLVWVVKWVFGKLRDIFRFLGRYFNLYWKWIGGLAGIALLRFILVAASGSAGLAIMLDLVCAALLAVFLIRVIVQMYRLKDGAKKIADGETDIRSTRHICCRNLRHMARH